MMFYLLILTRPPRSPLFPYTTLFRSNLTALGEKRFLNPVLCESLLVKFLVEVSGGCSCSIVMLRSKVVLDRKSTRLNSSHGYISYAVFCLKKKNHRPSIRALLRHCSA